MIVKALDEVGFARSIVIDEDGQILAGNATYEAACEKQIERVIVVEATGNEVIAVRRSGLSDAQKVRLALLDNRAAEESSWDTDVLAALDPELLDGLFYESELAELSLPTPDEDDPAPAASSDDGKTEPDECRGRCSVHCKTN